MKQVLVLSVVIYMSAIQVAQAATFPRRQLRNFHHPAFSMLSMFPGLGSPLGNTECIKGDIVCPSYCIMEDDWGCKVCPCAPANGMQPPTASPRGQVHNSNNEHECLGTILCMLTCKDGYRLGPRTNDGCQPCECVKKNQTNVDEHDTHGQQTQDCVGAACSPKNALENLSKDTSKPSTSKQFGCEWPLCMNGQSSNSGPEPGTGLLTLPKGGGASSKGEMIPGIDCLGPACSAKNGMRSFPQSPSATSFLKPLPSTSPSPDVKTCPSKETCARGCDGTTKLGPPGLDGCPVCECIIFKVATAPPTSTTMTQPKSTLKTCPQADYCKATCQYGFRIDQSNDRQNCPICECIFPKPPPPSTNTERPSAVGLLKVCQDVAQCMDTCTTGYTLTSLPHEECPRCVCNKDSEIGLPCRDTLSCPNGCTVGYKCDRNGCPTCSCVRPREALLRFEVHTTFTDSGLKCGPLFSCRERCDFGYKTGENGCPTCLCLQPVTVETDTLQLIPTPAPAPQPVVVIPQQKPLEIAAPPSSGCLGPSCSSIHIPEPSDIRRTETEVQGCMGTSLCIATCRYGYLLRKTNNKGCKSCECIKKGDSDMGNFIQVNNKVTGPSNKIDTDLPSTNSEAPNNEVGTANALHQTDVGAETHHQLRFDITQHKMAEPRPSTAMEACPETIQCISRCNKTFELVPVDGHSCPACICKESESPCKNGSCSKKEHEVLRSTPSPGQCVAILHCVLTCTEGYDLGKYESNGCPTCKCLDK